MGSEQQNEATVDKEFLTTFARGLQVIKSFDAQSPSMTLTEVANKNGLARASARRFLLTLQKLGYVSCEGKQFKLTPRVLDLGYSYLSSLNFAETITPFLKDVAQQLDESCSATVLDDQDVVYIARVPRAGLIPINLQIGARLPAYATSSGRVLLSTLSEDTLDQYIEHLDYRQLTPNTLSRQLLIEQINTVRTQGFAIVDQELELGMRALSVPVYDRARQVRFAINMSCHASSHSLSHIESEFVPVLKDAAKQISQVLS
jgi:IclR family pca regulon transcriptional regulator